jgi:hypothetical protein
MRSGRGAEERAHSNAIAGVIFRLTFFGRFAQLQHACVQFVVECPKDMRGRLRPSLLVVLAVALWFVFLVYPQRQTHSTGVSGSAIEVVLRAEVGALKAQLKHLAAEIAMAQAHVETPCPLALTVADAPKTQPTTILTPPSTPSGARSETQHAWLTVVVPTVPRKHAVLVRTLESFIQEVSGTAFEAAVQVIVVNHRPGAHAEFESARRRFKDSFISFVDKSAPSELPPELPLDDEFRSRNQEGPTPAVLQQTLDVVDSLTFAVNRSAYLLMYEDDFHLCSRAMSALHHMIAKSNRVGEPNGWAAIRCSFGLAGIVLQNGVGTHADADRFRSYLLKHARRRPPDHLAVEFYAQESTEATAHFHGRRVRAFRYNILRHDGSHSTLREQAPWSMPGCFHELVAPQVFPVEAWDPNQCPNDDLWPCDGLRQPSIAFSESEA